MIKANADTPPTEPRQGAQTAPKAKRLQYAGALLCADKRVYSASSTPARICFCEWSVTHMSIEVKTRPLWPAALILAILLLLAIWIRATQGEPDNAVCVDLSDDCDEEASAGSMAIMRAAAFVPGDGGLFVPESSHEPNDVANPTSDGTPDDGLTISVYDHRTCRVVQMDFEEYIYRVTASEMPAGREVEALKAQAVAARTYAVRRIREGGCGRSGADICTDSGHCQAYHDADTLRANWGGKADEKEARVRSAVEATRGLIIEYQGQPINALFHASSGGHTENVENVYSEALPYLRGVASPGEDAYSGYQSENSFTDSEFRALADGLNLKLSDKPLNEQVSVETLTDAGQVAVLRVGEGALTGRQARKAFGLRSQCFDVAFEEKSVVFRVRGFGHGVGMSQNGADAMAHAGSDFRAIIAHYYTDVEIVGMARMWNAA